MAPVEEVPAAGAAAIGIGVVIGATVVPLWLTAPPTIGVPPIAGAAVDMPVEERAAAALDVFKEKLIKRGISLKSLDAGEPQASGRSFKISATIKQGIASDKAKEIAKLIRDQGPKGVQAQIQGDQLRVSGKKRDDLQAVQQLLRGADLDIALQFDNYR